MKKHSRILTLILCVCLIATVAAVSFTACNDKKTFTVTAQYNSSQGNVVLSSPASGEDGKYADGESVTATVSQIGRASCRERVSVKV